MSKHFVTYNQLEAACKTLGVFVHKVRQNEVSFDNPVYARFIREASEKWYFKLVARCNRTKFEPARKSTSMTLSSTELMVLDALVHALHLPVYERNVVTKIYQEAHQELS